MRLVDEITKRNINPKLLEHPEGRKFLSRNDPLMFAAIYMPHKLYNAHEGETISDVSLNDFHFDVIEYAKTWPEKLSMKNKRNDAFIAPRMTGKSTWIGHILPIWTGAFLHKRYILLFSDSDSQAKGWLLNFKMELSSNALLQEDFPEFCDLLKQSERSKAFEDNANRTQRGNGFVFQVSGADNNVLGANVGGVRPEIMLFDDIEPSESNYSTYEAKKRLNTVLSAHFYLNTAAIKVFIGTTTMPDSIIDTIRKVGESERLYLNEHGYMDPEDFRSTVEPDQRWVLDHHITCHYWPALTYDDNGTAESLWPEKWDASDLVEQSTTREFQMNMQNRPIGLDGGYWNEDDIVYDEGEYTNTIISVDPAVTTKRTSDYTGIVVASRGTDGKIHIRHAEQVKYASDVLADHVTDLITKYGAKVLYIETNQGGDLWKQVFKDVPARLRTLRQTEKKEIRAGQAFDVYRKGHVVHAKRFAALEEQMVAFPRVPHDDVLDAMVSAVLYFNRARTRVGATSTNYMEVD